MRRDVSFVIVNWNAREDLLACLASIEAHPPAGMWEAIVVDNDSSDGSAAAVRDRPNVRLIANDTNRGLAPANNQGMLVAAGDQVIICNPDVEFTSGSINELLGCLDRHPRAAFAFARLVFPDGSQQTCAGDLPTLSTALLGRQVARRSAAGTTEGFWWDGWAHDEERRIPRGLEACYAVRREAVAEIGLQDEGFRLDWEGIDWCERALASGWESWFCPTAEVVHRGGASIRRAELRWVVQSHRGIYRYFAKRSPAAVRPLLALAIAARAVLKEIAVVAGPGRYKRSHPANR